MKQEEFLAILRKYLPPHWAAWVNYGRVEVRDRVDRVRPLFSFDLERHSPQELFMGLPEIIGAFINQIHRDFLELEETVKKVEHERDRLDAKVEKLEIQVEDRDMEIERLKEIKSLQEGQG